MVYLPSSIKPDDSFPKGKQHLAEDPSSTDVFYDTLFDEYLIRPSALRDVLYPNYIRHYLIGTSKRYKNFMRSCIVVEVTVVLMMMKIALHVVQVTKNQKFPVPR